MVSIRSTAFALAAIATTVAAQSATVVVEASHGGAGNGLVNTTLSVPLGIAFTNAALQTVSTLFLTDATGVPVQSVTCTPYRYANGTGNVGLPFNSSSPSPLSTNTVSVGSLICSAITSTTTLSSSSLSPSSIPTSSGNLTSSRSSITSTVVNPTSTFVTTVPASPGSSPPESTITSVVPGGGGGGQTTSTAPNSAGTSTSATPSPSLNAGLRKRASDWTLPGLALVGAGFVVAV